MRVSFLALGAGLVLTSLPTASDAQRADNDAIRELLRLHRGVPRDVLFAQTREVERRLRALGDDVLLVAGLGISLFATGGHEAEGEERERKHAERAADRSSEVHGVTLKGQAAR